MRDMKPARHVLITTMRLERSCNTFVGRKSVWKVRDDSATFAMYDIECTNLHGVLALNVDGPQASGFIPPQPS